MADIIKNIVYYDVQNDSTFEGTIGADALNVNISDTGQGLVTDYIGTCADNVEDTLGLLAEAIMLNSGGSGSTVTSLSASNVTLSSSAQTALTSAGITATEADTAIRSLANTVTSTNSELSALSSSIDTLEDTIAALETDSNTVIVTVTLDDDGNYKCNRTYTELQDYINEGKNIYLLDYGYDNSIKICPLADYNIIHNATGFISFSSIHYVSYIDYITEESQDISHKIFYIFPTDEEIPSGAYYYDLFGTSFVCVTNSLLITNTEETQTISSPLSISGDTTFTGTVDFSEGTLTGISTPENDSDAVNKSYVDDAISFVTVDTSNFATTDYVDSSISTATSGLATTSYVTSATSSLASKTYVTTLLNQEVPYTIQYGTYIGNGGFGQNNYMNLDFGAKPVLLMISMTGYDAAGDAIEGASGMGTAAPWFSFNRVGQVTYGVSYGTCELDWYDTGVNWWSSANNFNDGEDTDNAAVQLNLENCKYSFMAVLER